jgi:hypothetical protein
MASYPSVCALVISLDKAERKALHRYGGSHWLSDRYGWVYQYILDHPGQYQPLKAAFAQAFPGSSLAASLDYLYNFLLRVMVWLRQEENPEETIALQYQQARVLFSKGLHALCFQKIAQSKQLALSHELFGWHLLLCQLEQFCRMGTNPREMTEADLIALQSEQQNALNYLQTQVKHQLQYCLMARRKVDLAPGTPRGWDASADDLAVYEQQLFSAARYPSFEVEKLHLMFQADYFLVKRNLQASVNITRQIHALFEEHPHRLPQHALHYIFHLEGALLAWYRIGSLAGMDRYFMHLEKLIGSRPEIRELATGVLLRFQLMKSLKLGAVEKSRELAQQAMEWLNGPYQSYALETGHHLRLVTAGAWLFLNKQKMAMQLLQPLLADKIHRPDQAIGFTARLLEIIALVDLGHHDLVAARLRSCKRLTGSMAGKNPTNVQAWQTVTQLTENLGAGMPLAGSWQQVEQVWTANRLLMASADFFDLPCWVKERTT